MSPTPLCARSVSASAALAGILLLLAGCQSTTGPGASEAAAPKVDSRLVEAQNRFGFDLLRELTTHDAGDNVLISPTSIGLALAMTYNGAAGETARAMAETLHLGQLSLDEVNQACADLMTALGNPGPDVELALANSLWPDDAADLSPAFLERIDAHYGTRVFVLDLADPGTPSILNAWVRAATRDKITDIVKPGDLDAATVLVLLNALYFKGDWTHPFTPRATNDADFTLMDGGKVTVPMMYQQANFGYFEDDKLQAVELPYGTGRLAMYVLLPKAESSLVELQAALTEDAWADWMGSFSEHLVNLHLPRFELEYESLLNEPLTALGMGMAFDPTLADFSPMGSGDIWIELVRHKSVVEVNEKGSEAAAGTIVIMEQSLPGRMAQMNVNRPFLFAIRDTVTGTVFFLGRILDPRN